MYITYEELRKIKHALPHGSVHLIAKQLNYKEQSIRNFFGAKKGNRIEATGIHRQPGPDGGIYYIEDSRVIDLAKSMINSQS